jgi:membrane protease subunit (stomatin/prohibitin family)
MEAMTMAEYIDREAAIKAIYDSDPNGIRRTLGFNVGQIEEALRAIPTADVAPVRHGRWALNKKYGDYECSECGQGDVKAMDFTNLKMRYCPNCGAKMYGAE